MSTPIRDLLYFDSNKAHSLWSQLAGGLTSETSSSKELDAGGGLGGSLSLGPVASARLDTKGSRRSGLSEKRIPHHDLLLKLEGELKKNHLVTDLTRNIDQSRGSADMARQALGSRPYILCEGWSIIEDYSRFSGILEKFDELSRFVHRSSLEKTGPPAELLALRREYEKINLELRKDSSESRRIQKKRRLEEVDAAMRSIESNPASIEGWLKDGISLWINTFSPDRMTLRVIPVDGLNDFQVVCSLSRKKFADESLDHILSCYGNCPSVKLGVLGLVTAIPPQNEGELNAIRFAPAANIRGASEFQDAFRTMFLALDELERLSRPFRFPSIAVQPIAVFRHVSD